jgi:thiol-disulfide isomerase/thioredoxin/mono/diheme cytochrome c family protein
MNPHNRFRFQFVAAVIISGFMSTVVVPQAVATQIGDQVPELNFKDIRYLPRSLADFGPQKAYVVFFTNTTCPLVQRYMPVLMRLDETYRSQGVQFVAVNVGPDDSIQDMAAHAIEFGALFPFVKDTDGSVTQTLGVDRTPQIAVLDGDRKLVYRGRVDSQYRLGGVSPNPGRADLEEAIKQVLAGEQVSVPETPVDGCKITLPKIPAPAEPITFSEHVAPIMKAHCQTCHRDNTAAPFSLATYDEVAGQGEMVAEVVMEQRMPPWYANPAHGQFANDRSLSRQERLQVAQWVATGMAEGDPRHLPEPFQPPTSEWEIGEPDLVLTMAKPSTIQADGYVPYEYTILPFVFLEDTWVEAFEIKPDNPNVVHHCNMAYGTLGGKAGGYETFITGYVPGGQAMDLAKIEPGVAFKIPARSVLGLQIHHVTTGKEEQSSISVGLRYAKSTVRKQSRHVILDTKMHIEPQHAAWKVSDAKTIPHDATVLGMFCHMHLRGKDMTFYAHLPNGETRTLLQIPNYNFDWQLGYEMNPGDVQVPAGTKIEVVSHYDNSAFNPYNPDPNRTVPYGQQTFDEMMNGFLFYTVNDEDLGLAIDPQTGRVVRSPG